MASFEMENTDQLSDMMRKVQTLDRKFRRACDQILLLNNHIEDLQCRYSGAMKLNRRSFRYSLRLKLATLEGVRNMFYEYASRCADDLEGLQNRLIGEHPVDVDDDIVLLTDSDTDSEDFYLEEEEFDSSGSSYAASIPQNDSDYSLSDADVELAEDEDSVVAAAAAAAAAEDQPQDLVSQPVDEIDNSNSPVTDMHTANKNGNNNNISEMLTEDEDSESCKEDQKPEMMSSDSDHVTVNESDCDTCTDVASVDNTALQDSGIGDV